MSHFVGTVSFVDDHLQDEQECVLHMIKQSSNR